MSVDLTTVRQIVNDPGTSDWLKQALLTALDRDIVDAFNDALLLTSILEERMRQSLDLK